MPNARSFTAALYDPPALSPLIRRTRAGRFWITTTRAAGLLRTVTKVLPGGRGDPAAAELPAMTFSLPVSLLRTL
jgi:hypothetical protein